MTPHVDVHARWPRVTSTSNVPKSSWASGGNSSGRNQPIPSCSSGAAFVGVPATRRQARRWGVPAPLGVPRPTATDERPSLLLSRRAVPHASPLRAQPTLSRRPRCAHRADPTHPGTRGGSDSGGRVGLDPREPAPRQRPRAWGIGMAIGPSRRPELPPPVQARSCR